MFVTVSKHFLGDVHTTQHTRYAAATRTDFRVQCIVQGRRGFAGLKTSSMLVHLQAHSIRFPQTRFLLSAKRRHQNFGRETRTCRPTCRPTFPISLSEKLGLGRKNGACSHDFIKQDFN